MSWSDLAHWWLEEVSDDSAYESVVTPLLLDALRPGPSERYLDLGCGEGRVMRAVAESGAAVYGLDVSEQLASRADAPTIVARLPGIPIKPNSLDGAYAVLVLEHLADHDSFFAEVARIVRSKGVLALVINHPMWTAPNSTPINDADGEVLWRPGDYFSPGSSDVMAGEGTVTFHHRHMASLLNAAAASGWSLRYMVEQPHPELEDQVGIPRLLACRWRLLP